MQEILKFTIVPTPKWVGKNRYLVFFTEHIMCWLAFNTEFQRFWIQNISECFVFSVEILLPVVEVVILIIRNCILLTFKP